MVDVEIKRRVRRGAEGRRVFVQPVSLILSSACEFHVISKNEASEVSSHLELRESNWKELVLELCFQRTIRANRTPKHFHGAPAIIARLLAANDRPERWTD